MKDNNILPLNWRTRIENIEIDSIEEEIFLLDNPVITSASKYPFRMDVTATIICVKGTSECCINLKPYTTDSPCLITILPGSIVEYKTISDDFTGHIIVMSTKFTDSLMANISERMSLFLALRENPIIPLEKEMIERMVSFFEMLKRMTQAKEHPHRLEITRHLTMAFLYGASDFHTLASNRDKTHQEVLAEKFLSLVQTHYREQRGLEFYAGKLCITSKHLSRVLREIGSKSANDLIDDYVALEAKALLKSTNMTIQQISDELNFPSQSFFGKYFKRVTGMSPKEYKTKG